MAMLRQPIKRIQRGFGLTLMVFGIYKKQPELLLQIRQQAQTQEHAEAFQL